MYEGELQMLEKQLWLIFISLNLAVIHEILNNIILFPIYLKKVSNFFYKYNTITHVGSGSHFRNLRNDFYKMTWKSDISTLFIKWSQQIYSDLESAPTNWYITLYWSFRTNRDKAVWKFNFFQKSPRFTE